MILQEAKRFVARFVKGDHTPEEYATFLRWLEKASAEELSVIADEHEALLEQWNMPVQGPSEEWVMNLEHKLDAVDEEKVLAPVVKIDRRGLRIRVLRVAVAAAVMILGVGGYFFYNHSTNKVSDPNSPINNPFNGKGAATDVAAVVPKEFSVVVGGQEKQFSLPDGTQVWLNTASSLKYLPSFASTERVVELSGEAYFDVAKNAAMPFRVKVRGAEIAVLGTKFNVKAYEDEAISRITLVDGSVKIVRVKGETLLKPGDQATVSSSLTDLSAPVLVSSRLEDLDQITSWKNGDLEFKDDGLKEVMRQIARRYDMKLQFEQGMEDVLYTGNFPRKATIQQILNILESQQIHSKIMDGKTIVVMH